LGLMHSVLIQEVRFISRFRFIVFKVDYWFENMDIEKSKTKGISIAMIGFLFAIVGFISVVFGIQVVGRLILYVGIFLGFVGIVVHFFIMYKTFLKK